MTFTSLRKKCAENHRKQIQFVSFPASAAFPCSCVTPLNRFVTNFWNHFDISGWVLCQKPALENCSLEIDIHAVIVIPHGIKMDLKILIIWISDTIRNPSQIENCGSISHFPYVWQTYIEQRKLIIEEKDIWGAKTDLTICKHSRSGTLFIGIHARSLSPFFFFFFLNMSAPTAYGVSRARDWIQASAATCDLQHNYGNWASLGIKFAPLPQPKLGGQILNTLQSES